MVSVVLFTNGRQRKYINSKPRFYAHMWKLLRHRFTYRNSCNCQNPLDSVHLFNVKNFKVFTEVRELLHIFLK